MAFDLPNAELGQIEAVLRGNSRELADGALVVLARLNARESRVQEIGDQLRYLLDMKAAIRATLLRDHLRTTYPDAFAGERFWDNRMNGHLVADIALRLASKGDPEPSTGLDTVQNEVDELLRVVAAFESARSASADPFDPFSFYNGERQQ